MFTHKKLIPVSVDGDDVALPERNTIWIWDAMDYGMQQRIAGAILASDVATDGKTALHTDMAGYQIVRLVENIGKWTGPAFKGVPLTRANIEALDPPERSPLLAAVLAAITERDAAASPNAVTTDLASTNDGPPN